MKNILQFFKNLFSICKSESIESINPVLMIDVPLTVEEITLICKNINNELKNNSNLTEDYKFKLDILCDRLKAIEEVIELS